MRYIKIFVIMMVSFFLGGCKEEPTKPMIPLTNLEILEAAADSLEVPTVFTENYKYTRQITYENKVIEISWESDKVTSLSNFGIVKPGYVDEDVTLTATFYLEDDEYQKEYKVIVPAMTNSVRFDKALKEIEIPETVSGKIDLLTSFVDEAIKVTWQSSHPQIISNTGEYYSPKQNTEVTLTVILELGSDKMEKNYVVNALVASEKVTVDHHLVLDYVKDFDHNFLENVMIKNDRLVLKDDALEGTYLSKVFEVENLASLVASWGAITSAEATCEIEVRVLVDKKWSMYFSYGAWGLGLKNQPMLNGNDTIAKLSQDEIILKNGKLANAIQYRITLRRDSLMVTSPSLAFVALALDYENYEYQIDTTKLPSSVDYDVPKLNQNVVPIIGNSICSPTSSTMLLKYKGHDFSSYDEYENRYIANLAKDYGNDIFGNWTYCTVIIASYNETAYVMRMYSLDELKEHLANVGPVALSVKGTMDAYNTDKSYTTGGHLLVCRGYYEKDGQTIYICNDPNVKEVYVEYSEETIKRVWRMVLYVVE